MEARGREKDEMRRAMAGVYQKETRKKSRKMKELVEFVRDSNDSSEDSCDGRRIEYEFRDDDEEGEDLIDPREKKSKKTNLLKRLSSPLLMFRWRFVGLLSL